MDPPHDIIIVLGNPGAGKSSFLNTLAGEVIFPSGISIGSGLTRIVAEHRLKEFTLIDTPGLDDCDREIREKAALEIENLFKRCQGFRVKIVFVLTLEAGRFRSNDRVTMDLFNDAIGFQSQYSMIFNKVEPSVMKALNLNDLSLFEGTKLSPTRSILMCEYNPALECKKNQIDTPNGKLKEFIKAAPFIVVPKTINPIQHHRLEFDVKVLRSKVEILRDKNLILKNQLDEF
ncbi:Hypothetical protein POVR1_LOCUS100 [uncultured virus]|nr:Hypothetical protein POVR1_LOCUS100 [uncultured virus]